MATPMYALYTSAPRPLTTSIPTPHIHHTDPNSHQRSPQQSQPLSGMPAIETRLSDLFRRSNGEPSIADSVVQLARRGATLVRRGATSMPSPAGSIIALTVCALLAASLAMLAFWYFVRREGFVWREGDWEDYVSSVMRKPGNPDNDTITVFSDGSCRRGGAGSRGTRTIVLSDYDGMSRAEKSVISGVSRSGVGGWRGLVSRLRGGDWEEESNSSEYERRHGGRRPKRGQEKGVYFAPDNSDAHSIQTQEPARVPGWKPEDSEPERADIDRQRTNRSYYPGDDNLNRTRTNKSYYPGDDNLHRSRTNKSYYPGDDKIERSRTTKSYYPGDDKPHQKYSRHYAALSRDSSISESTDVTDMRPSRSRTKGKSTRTVSTVSSLTESDSSSSSEYETDTDDEAYGTKVYTHKLEKPRPLDLFDSNQAGPSDGYRSGRRGSLSTVGSVASSSRGRRR